MNTKSLALVCSITAVAFSGQAHALGSLAPMQEGFQTASVQLISSLSAKCQEAKDWRFAHRDKVSEKERQKYNRYYNRNCKSKKIRRATKRACKKLAKAKGWKFHKRKFSFTDKKTGVRFICWL
ncbi:MAG: hypothetical protein AAF184_20190 [Pseudomonadota bacterium]